MRLITAFLFVFFSSISYAETTLVAVASNFTKPMTEIASAFEKSTGHTAKLAFSSSGKFVSQIENGAPFEVFLSADEKNPMKLEQAKLAVENSRFTYAIGKLVLWSATENYVDSKGEILKNGEFKHIALADEKLAPYGVAAMEVLKNQNLVEKLKSRFVLGENISQTQLFVSSGNAELGFIALSQVFENGKFTRGSAWLIPENLYQPIRQDAVLLKTGQNNPAALALLQFLKSTEAAQIIRHYGYYL